MANPSREQLWVWLDSVDFGGLQRVGTLSRGSRGSISFSYEPAWLEHATSFPLDPELDLHSGEFYPSQNNFGVFLDSCPDRWGQTLMDRREAIEARDEKRRPRSLAAWDYLLGVQDHTRMGALRFSRPDTDNFLADETLAAPPVTDLPTLQKVAYELSRKKMDDLDQVKAWLRVLVAPGASLGGARPKANIDDGKGGIWIAKFPAANDTYDVAAWEMLLQQLARECGITVPEARIERIGNDFHTFLVRRFDRAGEQRMFFASAMAVLNPEDPERCSYLELAEFLATFGTVEFQERDLEELFTRVVFNAITGNRDDHLRNHGFVRQPEGWRLAPAYDMNPSLRGRPDHVLAFDDTGFAEPDLDVIRRTACMYRLSDDQAEEIILRTQQVVAGWHTRAQRLGLSATERLDAEHLFLT